MFEQVQLNIEAALHEEWIKTIVKIICHSKYRRVPAVFFVFFNGSDALHILILIISPT